ncbi:hypothetical protein ACHABX_11600 [Nesterenkonia halotolerans]|uniref:hypothetical protein n=1 Tax=Nesterenkonia halotolerans TaxID=225325 RepID=UPI003EE4E8CD
MFGKKKKRNHSWEHVVLAGVETARDWTAPKLGAAADWAEGTYRKSAPKVQDASGRALTAVNDGASVAGQKIKQYSSVAGGGIASQYDRLPPQARAEVAKVLAKYDTAKTQFTSEYVPETSARLGGYADKTAKLIHRAELDPRVEKALIKATGDKKIVKKLRKSSERYAKGTAKALKKQQRSNSRKKGLLIFGLVAATVTAGVAAWRASQPVEDPWKKPEPVTRPATSSTAAPKPVTSAEKPAVQGTPAAPAKPASSAPQTTSAAPKPSGSPETKAGPSGETNVNAQDASEAKGNNVPSPKPAT